MNNNTLSKPYSNHSLDAIAKALGTTVDKISYLKLETVFELLEKQQNAISAKSQYNMLASTFNIPTL